LLHIPKLHLWLHLPELLLHLRLWQLLLISSAPTSSPHTSPTSHLYTKTFRQKILIGLNSQARHSSRFSHRRRHQQTMNPSAYCLLLYSGWSSLGVGGMPWNKPKLLEKFSASLSLSTRTPPPLLPFVPCFHPLHNTNLLGDLVLKNQNMLTDQLW
jgi:hypothetical protein